MTRWMDPGLIPRFNRETWLELTGFYFIKPFQRINYRNTLNTLLSKIIRDQRVKLVKQGLQVDKNVFLKSGSLLLCLLRKRRPNPIRSNSFSTPLFNSPLIKGGIKEGLLLLCPSLEYFRLPSGQLRQSISIFGTSLFF